MSWASWTRTNHVIEPLEKRPPWTLETGWGGCEPHPDGGCASGRGHSGALAAFLFVSAGSFVPEECVWGTPLFSDDLVCALWALVLPFLALGTAGLGSLCPQTGFPWDPRNADVLGCGSFAEMLLCWAPPRSLEILATSNLVCIRSILSAKYSENFSLKEHVDPLKEEMQCGSLA